MNKEFLLKQLKPSKLLFAFLFHGLHIAIFAVGWYVQENNKPLHILNGLNWSVWLSRGAGLVLTVDGTLILLPMCRNLMTWLRPKLRWIPLDETQWFHRQVAYSMLFYTIIHVTAHYVNFFNVERFQARPLAAIQIHYTEAGGITGHVMVICMFLMYTTSHYKVRQQNFETFWYTHHLFIVFLLALYTHATGCFVRDSVNPYSPFAGTQFWKHCGRFGYEGWRWELVAGAIYIVERLYRWWNAYRYTEITKVIRHPYDAIEIQFAKPSMKYRAGQWLFINVPSVSRGQWHPFTITSCPFDPYVSIHVRQVGDWTKDLANALGAGPEQKKLYDEMDPFGIYEVALDRFEQMPKIHIDGPYGAPAEDVFNNEVAILVGTGIGVTPWASILKNLWHLRKSPNPPKRLRRVEFIWVCRDTTSFEWFQQLLASLEYQSLAETTSPASATTDGNQYSRSGREFLRIHTYLTQKLDVDMANNIVLNSVGMDKDPLTELHTRTNFGRPDWVKFMTAVRDGIMNEDYVGRFDRQSRTDVGVYFCGPNAAAAAIQEATKKVTRPQVRFRFWKEHF